jgi:hypothetical protein
LNKERIKDQGTRKKDKGERKEKVGGSRLEAKD